MSTHKTSLVGLNFVEVVSLLDFARYVCASRKNPLRVYSYKLNGKMILSSRRILSNSLLSFYVPTTKTGRYISYSEKGGKEQFDIVNSTKTLTNYAPIINLAKIPSQFTVNPKRIKDKFKPIEVKDLGSLVRLTYDPEFPDEPDLALFVFPHKKKWIIGNITTIDFDETMYFFNYTQLDKEPTKPFMQYSQQDYEKSFFTDTLRHGYQYLPIIKLKTNHKIFGFD